MSVLSRSRSFILATLPLVSSAAGVARAQEAAPEPLPPTVEAFRVLDVVPEGPRITPLLLDQLDRAWQQDEARRTRFESVRTEAELRALQAELRVRLLRTIGGLPAERPPLQARIVGSIPSDGYRIEKLVFESLPGLHVTALVYVPDGAGPRPAVLLACGHSPVGKAHPAYQEIAARLAKRGYVVLCWDPVGQGERSQFWDAARGRSRYNLVCGEHAVLGNLALLAGLGLGRYMVWDGIRAVDYLLTRPDVDGGRLAITGTSGGGFQALWIGALDERVKVVLPSCFPTALPMRMANRIFEDPDSDPEQDPFGLVSAGIDHAGLLLLIAPRPVHVAAAVKDFFPIEGTRKTVREVTAVYRRLGLQDRLALTEGYHEHRYSAENQEAAFAFLDRWLELPVRGTLPAVSTLPPEALRCTPSGQVRVDFPGRSLVDVIREDGAARRAGAAWSLAAAYRSGHADVSAMRVLPWEGRRTDGVLAWESRGSSRVGDVVIDRYRLYQGERLVLPAVHVHRFETSATGGRSAPLVLDLGLAGKAGPAEWPLLLRHLGEGREVLSFDPRGLGETRMRYRATSVDDPDLAPPDEETAYASPVSGVLANHVYNALLLGRPYLLDLVEDVELAARFAREKLRANELLVSGRGEANVVATAAADVLGGLTAVPAPGETAASLDWWRETLGSGREAWPIQLLLPDGAALVPSRGGQQPLAPSARLDAWRVIGPGGGGTMRRPAISPHDPKRVVLGCDMTGAYITDDGGLTWRMFNLGSVPTAFAFDPSRPTTIYAGAEAVYRSDDSGRTWRMVLPDPARHSVARSIGDHGDRVLFTEDPAYPGSGRSVTVHAIAVDADEPERVYVAASAADSPVPGTPASPTLLIGSADAGRSWSNLTAFGSERIFALRADGSGRAAGVRAIGETGVYDGTGGQWQHFTAPGGARFTSGSLGRDPRSGVVFAYATLPLIRSSAGAMSGGVQLSEDGGRTWTPSNGSLLEAVRAVGEGEAWGPAKGSQPMLGPIAASEHFPLVAYVGLRGVLLPGRGDGPWNGIARTTDGGRTWSVVHAESDRPSANLTPSWIEPRAQEDGHSVWFDSPYDLAVAPHDPDVAYATDLFRTYRTLDGGHAWAQVNSEPRGEDRWTTRGLDVTTTYGIQFDPHDPKRVFIPYTDIGLFRSEDGGLTWTGSSTGIPTPWRNTTYWLAFDPEVKDLVWGGFSGTHDLPRPKMWRRTDPARFKGGVAVSTDGARHWTVSSSGMQESAITHVLVDPRSPKGNRTLYAAGFGRGVYKSTDNGRSWALKNNGLATDTRNQPFAWRLTLVADGTLYLVVARRSERGRIGDRDDGALYRSTDGAESWKPVPLPPGTNGPNGLTVDPRDPRRLYLSAWGVTHPDGDTGGGIFLSTDAGATWRNVLPEAQHVYDVTVDPRDPSRLYASGFDQAAFRSSDRGETWTRIRGFNFKWGQRVVPDPADASKIYVTTFGGSVWHGPAEGDPNAAEDVVAASPEPSRLDELVEANVLGTQAFQVALAKKEGKGDPVCYSAGTLTDAQLAAIETHQAALLKADVRAVRAWAEGRPSTFDPKTDLERLLGGGLTLSDSLPVNVLTRWLGDRTKAPRLHVRAIASLFQTNLEVERDGDRLQEQFAFYAGLGLPVYLGQLGLPGTDADFLAMGRELEGKSCASPVGTSAAEWQIAARKNWNWGEKNLGIRDDKVLAAELLAEPDVKALVPRIRAMPAQRIAVIGHSFTMQLHWSTPGAFVPVVTAIFARENPKLEFRQFQGGGLTSTRAMSRFYADVVAWKPQQVLLVLINRTDEDLDNFGRLGRGLAAAGARVLTFDDLHDPKGTANGLRDRELAVAREAGMTVIEVSPLVASAPDRERFVCLDGIHMTEPYHRLMAKQWLEFLVGDRGAALPSTAPGSAQRR